MDGVGLWSEVLVGSPSLGFGIGLAPGRLELRVRIQMETSADGLHWMPLVPDIYDLTARALFPPRAPLDEDNPEPWRALPEPRLVPRLVLRL